MGWLKYHYDVTRTNGKNVFCIFSSFPIQSPILSYTFIQTGSFTQCKNERNINLLGDSIYNLRFQNTKLIKEINELLTKNKIPIKPDTIKLKGIQENQLMWKDILLKDISVGYYNVSKINVALFDRSISSLKQKMK